jgi:hypothetical protein
MKLMKLLLSPWFAAVLVQAMLAAVLFAKKLWRRFPFFVSYATANFLLGIALYAVYVSRLPRIVYFDVYWLSEGIGLFLGLAVVSEIFKNLLTPYPALRRLAAQIFRGATVFLVLLGCVLIYAQPVGEQSRIQAAFFLVEQVGRILEVGLLVFLFVFASVFGLHWRQYLFGIALGLGIFVTVELVAVTLRTQFGFHANSIFSMIRAISFNLSMFIWISYLLAPELAVSPSEVPKRAQLEQWNKAIMELIYQ